MSIEKFKRAYVKLIYGDHNNSQSVKKALLKCINYLGSEDIGLNIGAGYTKLGKQIKNMDIFHADGIDYVGEVECIPLENSSVKLVITQEVLEHVKDVEKGLQEIYRVLKKDGLFYCQVPFIIGYHPGPNDYWRFTKEGIREVIEKHGFEILELETSVGSATGFYRISVEFFAILFSVFFPFLYIFLKALFALLLYPIKWLDPILDFSNQKNRIPGGYYLIAKK